MFDKVLKPLSPTQSAAEINAQTNALRAGLLKDQLELKKSRVESKVGSAHSFSGIRTPIALGNR